ncbi:MAG: iron-sulfur cluster assembly scaffold protein [Firmicutes bacterium]|nr:iron-sulfur cluster assembly scaffold protein [Bacillota bacterium]
MYSELVMQRFAESKNAGKLKGSNAKGIAGNIEETDVVRIYLIVSEQDIIEDAKFRTFGCLPAIVASDILCDLIRGQSVEKALLITESLIWAVFGPIPEGRAYCATLVLQALHNAFRVRIRARAKVNKVAKAKVAKKEKVIKQASSTNAVTLTNTADTQMGVSRAVGILGNQTLNSFLSMEETPVQQTQHVKTVTVTQTVQTTSASASSASATKSLVKSI